MTVPRFFIDAELAAGRVIELPPPLVHHARTLRLGDGAAIVLFNGRGGQWRACFRTPDGGKSASAGIEAFDPVERESPLALTLIQSWTTTEKLDWIVEKATELGVQRIVLAPAVRCLVRLAGARLEKRLRHLRGVAVAACGQCGRNRIPTVEAGASFTAALSMTGAVPAKFLMLPTAPSALAPAAGTRACAVLVGPEGGFDEAEQDAALGSGFAPAHLGPRVLRTETAGLAAAAVLQVRLGDLA